jgi:hypothetical protein
MSNNANTKLTSVKIIDRNYYEFKKMTLDTDIIKANLQCKKIKLENFKTVKTGPRKELPLV